MRTYPLLLVAAVTLSVYADASSTRSRMTFERPAPSHQHARLRFLRDEAETTEEERTFGVLKGFLSSIKKTKEARLVDSIKKNHSADDNLLSNNDFKELVELLGKQNTKPEVTISKFLASRLTDTIYLDMLKKSTEDSDTKVSVTKLQDGWIQSKVEETDAITNGVIKSMLKLINFADENVLNSQRFKKYMTLMNRKHASNLTNLDRAMAQDLINHYGTNKAAFLKMLEESLKKPSTEAIAKRIFDGYIKESLEKKVTPEGMYLALGLKDVKDVLSNTRFQWWEHYVNQQIKHKKRLLNPFVIMADALIKTYRDDPEKLDAIIDAMPDHNLYKNNQETRIFAIKLSTTIEDIKNGYFQFKKK